MYALLGDIQFDLIAYFDGFESQFGADYAEHALIDGKPRLQIIGDKLDEIRLTLSFHAQFCEPERELARLKKALALHRAMALVLGNGDYKGWFVLTDVQATSEQTDGFGTLVAVTATATLREYVGDKKNPLPAPAVQPKVPPVSAKLVPTGQAIGAVNSARDSIRQAVSAANQAQAAMRTATDAVRVAQQLRNNPLAALGRVPGLMTGLGDAAAPLAKLAPALGGLTSQLPEAASLMRAGNNALSMITAAQGVLAGANTGNVVGKIDQMAGQLSTASAALEQAAPATAKLAAMVVTRAI
ncbi:phage tail protein [Jeongeupia wiesaeckerbachi]|uniref:phage tail protein n=1 Tax=Jeongeupia wiesaeckerbachi TaxID=3051218 RepID=UPI003D805DFD